MLTIAPENAYVEVAVPPTGKTYQVVIGFGSRSTLRAGGALIHAEQRVAVIADRAVAELHLPQLRLALGGVPHVLLVEPGEASKSLATARRLYDELAAARLERGDVVLSFGGGVVGDLGGFVAATWLRGLSFVQTPTTLEAAIDASVGGKTGVNTPAGKNLVGAFHQPDGVVIDADFLVTLPQREYVAALAESVKHAVICDAEFLAWHEANVESILSREPRTVLELIRRNVSIKARIVAADEREQGLRAMLNYGHTAGHAIEHEAGYALRHGECVALGILAENEIAVRAGWLSGHERDRVAELLRRLGLPAHAPRGLQPDALVQRCLMDKKVRSGAVRIARIDGLGRASALAVVSASALSAAFTSLLHLPSA